MATSPQFLGLHRRLSNTNLAGDKALPSGCQEDVIVKRHTKSSSLFVATSSHQGKGEQIFHKFPELPVEIQIFIWGFAVLDPQVITISLRKDVFGSRLTPKPIQLKIETSRHALGQLLACRDGRQAVVQTCNYSFAALGTRGFWLNYQLDTIYFKNEEAFLTFMHCIPVSPARIISHSQEIIDLRERLLNLAVGAGRHTFEWHYSADDLDDIENMVLLLVQKYRLNRHPTSLTFHDVTSQADYTSYIELIFGVLLRSEWMEAWLKGSKKTHCDLFQSRETNILWLTKSDLQQICKERLCPNLRLKATAWLSIEKGTDR